MSRSRSLLCFVSKSPPIFLIAHAIPLTEGQSFCPTTIRDKSLKKIEMHRKGDILVLICFSRRANDGIRSFLGSLLCPVSLDKNVVVFFLHMSFHVLPSEPSSINNPSVLQWDRSHSFNILSAKQGPRCWINHRG